MKQMKIEVGGSELKVFAQKINGALWVHSEGRTLNRPLTSGKSRRGRGQVSSDLPGHISALMPGKILKVNCSVGQKVNSGDTLVVMEAMKMEYSLKSNCDGTVRALNVAEGDQVTVGKLLVEVEPDG